jgi:hypothetical protein
VNINEWWFAVDTEVELVDDDRFGTQLREVKAQMVMEGSITVGDMGTKKIRSPASNNTMNFLEKTRDEQNSIDPSIFVDLEGTLTYTPDGTTVIEIKLFGEDLKELLEGHTFFIRSEVNSDDDRVRFL